MSPISYSSSSIVAISSPRRIQKGHCDRFIPNRGAMDLDISLFSMKKNANVENDYQNALENTLEKARPKSKILAFKNKAPAPPAAYNNRLRVLYSSSSSKKSGVIGRPSRSIPREPVHMLDAPDMLDDYYLNLLDWSCGNLLAVALGPSVYLWNAATGSIQHLCENSEDNPVTSVSWIADGSHLAVGNSSSVVQIWDVAQGKQVRSMQAHTQRVGSLAWNGAILTTGSQDSRILHNDVRIANPVVAELCGHTQEVCGLKWSPDGTKLASGGNDNLLNIWDAENSDAPKFTFDQHTAAVKALAWCPWQKDLLASGGGTSDRKLRFWNTSNGTCVNQIDTESQVCAIQWSAHYRELVTSHGFAKNQLCVWNYPSLTKTAELTGHESRVLHMALSPDGETVATAAGDESIRFWNVFDSTEARKAEANARAKKSIVMENGNSSLRGGVSHIR